MEPEPFNRLCDDCDVRTTEPECWVCGEPTVSAPRLTLTSQHGYGPVMDDRTWSKVRQRVLAE